MQILPWVIAVFVAIATGIVMTTYVIKRYRWIDGGWRAIIAMLASGLTTTFLLWLIGKIYPPLYTGVIANAAAGITCVTALVWLVVAYLTARRFRGPTSRRASR